MRKPKVLLISHNVFDCRTNMGKTLCSFFSGWNPQEIAQLYLHSEVPTTDICHRYYRITDMDALKSVGFGKQNAVGRAFAKADIVTEVPTPRVDKGFKRKLYSFGRRRTPLIYTARNTMWRLSGWYSAELKKWIGAFAPDVIFLAAGDYAFTYDIAYIISRDFNIPVVMYCCDDYFINRQNPRSLLGVPVYKSLMKSVHRCISRTSAMITICDKMSDAYRNVFPIPIHTVYTGYGWKENPDAEGTGVVYLGNLGGSRGESLADIGRTLRAISGRTGEQMCLDIYSAETRQDLLRDLTEENGIVFHGSVDSGEVRRIIAESRLVIHTESFAPENRRKVMYSVSAKIADLLASGRCIFAYGPAEVASVEYLKKHGAACVADDPQELEKTLEEILANPIRRSEIVTAARKLAEKNHAPAAVQNQIDRIIRQGCGEPMDSCLQQN